MKITVLLALALVLVIEGLGPMLFPKGWRNMISSVTKQSDSMLRRYGGALVVAGIVIYFMVYRHLA